MQQILLSISVCFLLVSCSGKKQVAKAISYGDYDKAISTALHKLRNNKDKKRKQDYSVMLNEAYHKVMERDLQQINHLKKDGNPEQFKTIYETYVGLDARQNAIKSVLPLQLNGKELLFEFKDYTANIVDYRYKTSDYLIDEGITLLDSGDKHNARKAYDIFQYIEQINPNFEETRSLIKEAHQKGTDHVIVSIENQTHQVIPRRLETDLLDFNTYRLDHFWTVFHSKDNEKQDYDYALQLQLKQINVSPEQVNTIQEFKEKEIVDGWEYKRNRRGRLILDSLGNKIKVDKIINVKAKYVEVNQFKATQVLADVVLSDLKANEIVETFPIDSEFVFKNLYAFVRGDERALNRDEYRLTQHRRLLFPTDEQMIYDTGEDIKSKLKQIIKSYKIG